MMPRMPAGAVAKSRMMGYAPPGANSQVSAADKKRLREKRKRERQSRKKNRNKRK
jgi:hypothetical protein